MIEWKKFLIFLNDKIGDNNVQKWLHPLKIIKFDAANIYLLAENPFQITFFEEHVKKIANTHFINSNSHPIKVHLSLANEKQMTISRQNNLDIRRPISSTPLEGQLTFSNYLSSDDNEIAMRLLLALANGEDKSFNPIFIYGPSCSGKTHLLNAFALLLEERKVNFFYVNAKTFTEHVVDAIRTGVMQEFRNIYRSVDLLIIDDIHIIAKKNATQEELFHTFNALHSIGKHIILSSPLAPNQLTNIESRLISRFEWGIILNLKPPSKEVLRKILQNKLNELNLQVSKEVFEYLLATFPNAKLLQKGVESLVLKIHMSNYKGHLTAEQVQLFLRELIESSERDKITPDKIVHQVAIFFGIKMSDILSKSQTKEFSLPRQIAMYFCRSYLNLPFIKIGEYFSRDHSTVMTSIRNIQNRLDEKQPNTIQAIAEITKSF